MKNQAPDAISSSFDTPDRASCVQVSGARENNLKNVTVDIPRDAFVVFTGISGSGKSSLAFGTLYAEAQRRYLESVAPYARRLIDQAGVPEVDEIKGLPPAVALQQQRGSVNARSSVGSITTLSSLVRMLYSRVGDYPADQPMLYAEDFSPNTVEGACTTCQGIGRVYEATEKTMVPDASLTIRERAIASWPPAWHGQNLRDILVSLGYDVDIPWRDLPREHRDWILFTDEQPTVPVFAGFTPYQTRLAQKRGLEPSYQGTFIGARRYLLETLANTKSALMKKRVLYVFTHDSIGLGEDGPTHAGNFDLSYLRCIPNMIVAAPSDERETRLLLQTAYQFQGPAAVRYPRGTGAGVDTLPSLDTVEIGRAVQTRQGNTKVAILAFGTLLHNCHAAAEQHDADVFDMRWVKPLDTDLIDRLATEGYALISVEENAIMGGAGSAVSEYLRQRRYTTPLLQIGIPDRFIEHGKPAELLAICQLDSDGISAQISEFLAG